MSETKLKKQAMTDESWHEIGATGEPAFQNSWVNYGSGYATAAFMKDALGFVHIKGSIKSGTVAQPIFTVPTAYRPATIQQFAIPSNAALATLQINTVGEVTILACGSNAWASLDVMCYKV